MVGMHACLCITSSVAITSTFLCRNAYLILCFQLCFPVAIAVSRDHKPDQTDERQRIEDAGGFVMWAGKVTLSYICIWLFFLFITIDKYYFYRNMESWRCSCCLSCVW